MDLEEVMAKVFAAAEAGEVAELDPQERMEALRQVVRGMANGLLALTEAAGLDRENVPASISQAIAALGELFAVLEETTSAVLEDRPANAGVMVVASEEDAREKRLFDSLDADTLH
jgi:hypothetical protein